MKKVGRPPSGVNPAITLRLPPDDLSLLDTFRAAQTDLPGRPEAIRRVARSALAYWHATGLLPSIPDPK